MGLRGVTRGHAGHGHAGHSHGHATGGQGSHAAHGHAGGHGHAAGHSHGDSMGSRAMSLLSPRVMFSFLLGMGTAGIVIRPLVGGFGDLPLFALAVIGGVAFERFFVGPLWNFLVRFESNPAATLESAIDDEAKAVTNFDDSGHGLISIEVDGQMVQCLGALSAIDRDAGVRIRAGDLVRIEDVDASRNRCTVRRA